MPDNGEITVEQEKALVDEGFVERVCYGDSITNEQGGYEDEAEALKKFQATLETTKLSKREYRVTTRNGKTTLWVKM